MSRHRSGRIDEIETYTCAATTSTPFMSSCSCTMSAVVWMPVASEAHLLRLLHQLMRRDHREVHCVLEVVHRHPVGLEL